MNNQFLSIIFVCVLLALILLGSESFAKAVSPNKVQTVPSKVKLAPTPVYMLPNGTLFGVPMVDVQKEVEKRKSANR